MSPEYETASTTRAGDPEGATPEDEPEATPWYQQPTVVLPLVVVAILIVVGVVAWLAGQPEEDPEAVDPTEELQPDPEAELDPEAADPGGFAPDPDADPPPAPDTTDPDADGDPPEDVTFTGEGDATETFTHEGGLARFELAHDGDGAFTVEVGDLVLSDAEGRYEGSRAAGLSEGDHDLEIIADGSWEITVSQPRPTMGTAPPVELTGDGDTASEPIAHEGGALTLVISYEGTDDMIVILWSGDGTESLGLIDDPGPFEGREAPVRLPDGVFIVDVVADGEWSILVD